MASDISKALILDTYEAVVSAYGDFLIVAIHTILYERNIYPQNSFLKARKYNYPVRQNRHPKVCNWILDAVAAVEAEMLKCTIEQTSLIIHAPPPASTPLERYIFSTASFPRIPNSETLTPFAPSSLSHPTSNPTNPSNRTPNLDPATERRFNPPPAYDLPEQFRATLARLSTSLTKLTPLPEKCSFTLAIELRDEDGVEAPLGREWGWIAAGPGLQRERRDGSGGADEGGTGDGDGRGQKGKDLGGVKTTPVRKLEAGAFAMEVWIEEGRGKFEGKGVDGFLLKERSGSHKDVRKAAS